MRIKENLTRNLRFLFLTEKTIGRIRFVPYFVINLYLTFMVISLYVNQRDSFLAQEQVINQVEAFLPFFSVWNVTFIIKEYIESEGREVLYTMKKRKMMFVILLYESVWIINSIIMLLIYSIFFSVLRIYIVKLLFTTVFILGLICFLSFLFKSTAPALLVSLVYLIYNVFSRGKECNFLLYTTITPEDNMILSSLPLFVIGILLIISAQIIIKRFTHYIF